MEMIPVANVITEEEDAKAVYEVVRSGWISKGKKVEEFERKFSKKVNSRTAIAVNSGTAALHTILAALGIGPNDEVILPSLTFISTANAVLYQGATPVLVECRSDTFNTTAEAIKKAITPRTKAIITVDMNGMPVDYDSINALGRECGLPVVADSAESLGAVYKGKPIGGVCDIHMFSFFPNKSVTTGEGGMITTNDHELEERMRKIMNQGQDGRYNHVMLGYNYRMNDILAALGIVQLKRLDEMMKQKHSIVCKYNKLLSDFASIELPHVPQFVDRHSWYMYSVKVAEQIRDNVVSYLTENMIETRLSFPPIHIQKYYQERFDFNNESLPISYSTWKRLINLPIWPGISKGQIEYVATKLIEAVEMFS